MDSIVLQSNREKYSANIELPLSKSISNRLLMIYAAMGWDYEKLFISKADDTQLLKKLLPKGLVYLKCHTQYNII